MDFKSPALSTLLLSVVTLLAKWSINIIYLKYWNIFLLKSEFWKSAI